MGALDIHLDGSSALSSSRRARETSLHRGAVRRLSRYPGNQRQLYSSNKGASRGAGPVPRRLGHDAGLPRLSSSFTGFRGHGVNTALAGATERGVFFIV